LTSAVAAILLAIAGANAAERVGPCPVTHAPPCEIVLAGPAAPSASAACTSEAWVPFVRFPHPERWTNPNRDGSWEAVIEIRLAPSRDCGCARVEVDLEERTSGWTFHVANSPTNNGHGGDAGTTSATAEMQLAGSRWTVFTAAHSERRDVDRLFDLEGLGAARRVSIEVCEQSLAVESPGVTPDGSPVRWRLATLGSELLFAFGSGREDGGSLYLGLNRVVHRLDGAPSHGRSGTGVRRATITLLP
jgi:hypothetical protein